MNLINATIELLGTGTSTGVPMIDCDCRTCRSSDPRDRRTRTSAAVYGPDGTILIDTTPDLKRQLLRSGIQETAAVLYTHHHFDHIGGFDDLRLLNFAQRKEIPIYGTAETLAWIERMFGYAFGELPTESSSPRVRPIRIEYGVPFAAGDIKWTPIPLKHGKMTVTGFLSGAWGYCTDCNEIPPESIEHLRSVTDLVLDGLRRRKHTMHFTIDEAVEAARTIGADRTHLTHIAHDMTHREIEDETPANIAPGFDGLRTPVRLEPA